MPHLTTGAVLGLERSFQLAAVELGRLSAARLFVRVLAEEGGATALDAAEAELGEGSSMFAAVAAATRAGAPVPAPAADVLAPVVPALDRVLVAGLETDGLDALVARWPALQVGLVRNMSDDLAWARVMANYGGRLCAVSLEDWPAWAGPRSALLTFCYGFAVQPGEAVDVASEPAASDGATNPAHPSATSILGRQAWVDPLWLRMLGPDTNRRFSAQIGWNLLPVPPSRTDGLEPTPLAGFSAIVPAAAS